MKPTNVLFSFALHVVLFAFLLYSRSSTRKFEGYPTVIPIEIVEMRPVTYKAPTVEQVAPKIETPKTQPKLLEGVTVETPKIEEPEEEEPPKEIEKKVEEDVKPSVKSENMRLDAKEFPFSYYLALLQSRIQANWEPPFKTGSANQKTLVFFKIQRNGRLENIRIESGSGDYLFDQAALRAVTLANPLPPLPFDFPEPNLGVHFEFEQGI